MAAALTDRPGTVAKVRFVRMSASKVRVVLNLIRGKSVTEALDILDFGERLAASEVAKCLRSAIANAEHNEDIPAEELFVAACFSDEGPTLKRFRPRARGRAGKIHKQTCHITIEVRRYTDEEILDQSKVEELKAEGREKRGAAKKTAKKSGGDRSKRVAKSKAAAAAEEEVVEEVDATEEAEAVEAEATEEVEASEEVEAAEEVEAVEEAADEEVVEEAAEEADAAADSVEAESEATETGAADQTETEEQ